MQSGHRNDIADRQGVGVWLWWLPALAGLLPAVGVAIGAQWSAQAELVPVCNPLLQGCFSISRAGRHGLANQLYHIGLLPGAVLQALTWVVCARWLRSLSPTRASFPMAAFGIVAGLFLVLYGSFLGVEGAAYRWLRQYGTVGYFGGTYLCMLLLVRQLWPMRKAFAAGWQLITLLGLCIAMLVLCVVNTAVAPMFHDPVKDRIENISEWWTGMGFTAVFFLLAWLWKKGGVSVLLQSWGS